MVPFCLPGERVQARIFRNHKNYSEADLVQVLTPSPHRVSPPCPVFGQCGGCQYQHFTYSEQLAWKRRQVAELLEHMAGITFPVDPVVPSPREYGYRSKITPHFDVRGPIATDFPIGFLKQGSRFSLVDVPRCEIATEAMLDSTNSDSLWVRFAFSAIAVATEPGPVVNGTVSGKNAREVAFSASTRLTGVSAGGVSGALSMVRPV